MSRYKKLISNSVIFSIGNLGSKLVAFILVPLYTHYLSAEEYGLIDIIITTNQMLLPIISLSVYDAVFRFVLDSNKKHKLQVIFSNALFITLIGNCIFLVFFPLFKAFEFFEFSYLVYLYIILFLQSIQALLSQFTRARGLIRHFTLNGIIMALIIAISSIVLLVGFDLGVSGYLIAIIIGNLSSIIFLGVVNNIFSCFELKEIKIKTIKQLIIYSIPLIPNSFVWWLNNSSARYFLYLFLGTSANGLYAIATKIPSLLSMMNNIFFQSWQISAVEEFNADDKGKFYSNVFSYYSQFLFLVCSLLLVILRLIPNFLSTSFQSFWVYTPFLLLGVIYSSFSGFLGTTYIAAKRTNGLMYTTLIGAVINIALNYFLIPKIGINGAGIANMISFFFIWLIRMKGTRKYLIISLDYKNLFLNHVIIIFQIILIFVISSSLVYIIQFVLFLSLIWVNRKLVKELLYSLKSIKAS